MTRLDVRVAEIAWVARNRAQFFIDSGLVCVNGKAASKSSIRLVESDVVTILEDKRAEFVSRSAVKLDDFLVKHPQIAITGSRCIDVGSSTGWFTQVLLMRGAQCVDAVDVWTDQLHEKLRSDPRVRSYERTDIRDFRTESVYDIAVMDVSFIASELVIPSVTSLLVDWGCFIMLFKPQFEMGKGDLSKAGVVRDTSKVRRKLWMFVEANCEPLGEVLAVEPASIEGEAGNQEYLIAVRMKKIPA